MSTRKSYNRAVSRVSQIIEDLQEDETLSNKTEKLWIQYLKMVRVLLLFIRAERTADWELHLYCIANMIPVFHAGGHTVYAKSTRLSGPNEATATDYE